RTGLRGSLVRFAPDRHGLAATTNGQGRRPPGALLRGARRTDGRNLSQAARAEAGGTGSGAEGIFISAGKFAAIRSCTQTKRSKPRDSRPWAFACPPPVCYGFNQSSPYFLQLSRGENFLL